MGTLGKKGTQGRRTPKSQLSFIAVKRREGYSISRILEDLQAAFGSEARGERTVQNHVKRIDESRLPWDRFATDGDDAKLIFEVLAEVIRVSKGNKSTFTQEEADTVLWVRKSAPDLQTYYVWVTAVLYITERQYKPESVQEFSALDAFIAVKPWQSLDAMDQFYALVDIGAISDASMLKVAIGVRACNSRHETKDELQELKEQAATGDPDAVFAVSLFNGVGATKTQNQKHEDPPIIADTPLIQTGNSLTGWWLTR